MTSLSRSSLFNRRKAGAFPEPVQIGPRRIGWRESEIVAWIDTLPRARA